MSEMSPAGFGEGRHLSLRSINHISKVCSSVEASVAIYRDVLGFILVKRPQSFNDSFEGCWLWRYGLGLHLIKGEPVPRSRHIDPKSDHVSFQADSLDEVEAQLRRGGIPFVRQVVVEDGMQVQQLFFLDPDANMIEVCNCDCLPIIPLDLGRCPTCAEEATKPGSPGQQACRMQQCQHPQQLAQRQLQHTFSGASSQHSDDEMMSGISRESMDSMRSEQFNNAAAGLAAAAPLPHF